MTSSLLNRESISTWSPALLGPIALGVASGAAWGVHETVKDAVALPLITLGVTAIMTPALYIGVNVLGMKRSAHRMATATFASLRTTGLIMSGFAPAVAFVLISNGGLEGLRFLAGLVAEAAVVIGIWKQIEQLRAGTPMGAGPALMLSGWTLIGILLNAHMLGRWLIG